MCADCILDVHCPWDINVDNIFNEVHDKLKGRVASTSFQGLSEGHKCWCFYWYYAVNFFYMGGCESQELPHCFVAAVRKWFPDPKGKYTGYKPTDDCKKAKLEEHEL